MKVILLFLFSFVSFAYAKLYLDNNFKFPLDTELYKRVLNPQECQKQLEYIRTNDSLLMARFIDAGIRAPRGITLGNLRDLGNYPQCLGIHEVSHDMIIEGKFCVIKVPLNQLLKPLLDRSNKHFDPHSLQLSSKTVQKIDEIKYRMRRIRLHFADVLEDYRINPGNFSSKHEFQLALCVPRVCTTEETISGLLFNATEIGFKYYDDYCRLPDDKPWAPVDYIAIIIFSTLGILTVLSTFFDVHSKIILKKDSKEVSKFLISFSAITNCRRLLTIKPNPDNIECLDGVRALAMFWVIVGHVFDIINEMPSNPVHTLQWSQSYESIWIMAAPLTVDTFFFLSGLLLVYNSAAKLTGNTLIKNLPVFYLNRLLRLFPVLAAVVLYEASFSNRIGDGPLWHELAVGNVHKCRTFWWTTLLHLQNIINPEQACLVVTWYLAIDVQLHIISPIVLFWVLGRSRFSAWTAVITALFTSLAISTAYIFLKDSSANFFVYYYVNIITRAPAFFVGLVYGYILHVWRKRNAKMPIILNCFITAFFISLIFITMYCKFMGDLQDFNNKLIKNLFDAFLRPLWVFSIGWIIFACVNGYGGPINWFLCLNVWKVPSRISYAMYLTHFSIITAVYSSSLQPLYFTVRSAIFDSFGFLWLSMFVSFFVTVLIDAPFAIIFKALLGYVFSRKRYASKKIANDETTEETNSIESDIAKTVDNIRKKELE